MRESIFFSKNIGEGTKDEYFIPATMELRRLAARADALLHTSWRPAKLWWKFRGYDIALAVRGLTGLSNSLSFNGGAKAIYRHQIEKALHFPFEYSDKKIKDIWSQMAKGEGYDVP